MTALRSRRDWTTPAATAGVMYDPTRAETLAHIEDDECAREDWLEAMSETRCFHAPAAAEVHLHRDATAGDNLALYVNRNDHAALFVGGLAKGLEAMRVEWMEFHGYSRTMDEDDDGFYTSALTRVVVGEELVARG